MTEQEQLIAIAEACGWTRLFVRENDGIFGIPPVGSNYVYVGGSNDWAFIPNFLADLNACHEMEKALTNVEQDLYTSRLLDGLLPESSKHANWLIAHAPAAQRAKAFLKTKGLWKD